MTKPPPFPTIDELRPAIEQVLNVILASGQALKSHRETLISGAIYAPHLLDGHRFKLLEAGFDYPSSIYYFQPTQADFEALVARQQAIVDKPPKDIFDPIRLPGLKGALLVGAPAEFGKQIHAWRKQDPDGTVFDSMTQHLVGRSLTKSGLLRQLYFRDSIELDVVTGEPGENEVHVGPFDLDEACDECGTPLFAVVAGETTGRLAFLSNLGPTIVIPLCPTCVAEHRSTTTSVDLPMPMNKAFDPATKRLVLGLTLPTFGGWHRYTCHLGGFPRWQQDPEYPKCPDCSKTMRFLLQVRGYSLDWGYCHPMCFVCDKCRTLKTVMQTD